MIVLLILVVFVVLGRIATHDFGGFDDHWTLSENPRMNPPSLRNALYYWRHTEGHLYVPVTFTLWSSLASVAYLERADAENVHLNPWIFHGASVVVHALAGLVVFLLLRRLIASTDRKGDWAALLGALVFAIHPIQVESVAWTSGMKDLLCGLFGALALWQSVLSLDRGSSNLPGRAPNVHYILASLFFILALLSKPTAMVIPAMGVVAARGILGIDMRTLARTMGPWLVLALAWAALTKAVQPATGVEGAPGWARPLIAADAVNFYLSKLVWPADLAPDYGRHPRVVLERGWHRFTWILPAACAVALFVFRKRLRAVVVASLLFIIGMSPLLGLVPFEFQGYSTVSDHYLYLPMIGVALIVAWFINRFRAPWVMPLACALTLALGAASFAQARHWATDREIWRHVLHVNPDSWVGNHAIGSYLANEGKLAEAERHFRRSVEAHPRFVMGHYYLAMSLADQNRHLEAAAHYAKTIELSEQSRALAQRQPNLGEVHARLGRALAASGRRDEATAAFEKSLQQRPGHAPTMKELEALRPRQQ